MAHTTARRLHCARTRFAKVLLAGAATSALAMNAQAQADIFVVDGFDDSGEIQAEYEPILAPPSDSVPIQAQQGQPLPQQGFPPEGLPPEGLQAEAIAPSQDDLFLQSLTGGGDPLGGPVAPQGVAGAATFVPLSKQDILASKPSTLFIESEDGTYHPELANCQLVGDSGSYDCIHSVIGQFYAHAVGGDRVVKSLSPAHPSEGAADAVGFSGGNSAQASASGFTFSPYLAARGAYALAGKLEANAAGYEPTLDAGYGGSLAVGSYVYTAGNIAARAEAEAAYRQMNMPTSDDDAEPGTLSQLTAMANVYVDFLVGERFVLSAGGGVGGAQQTLSGVRLAGQSGAASDGSHWSLAYQGMVGAGFKVTPNLTVFGEFRRIQVQNAITDVYSADYTSTQGVNEVAVGVRLALGGL